MRSTVAVTSLVLMVFGLSVLCPTPCEAQGWGDLVPALTQQLTSLWQNNELEFMGNTCYYSQKPKIRRWQLYFYGRFTCPAWTPIRGSARTRSKSGVMAKTIENFLQQAKSRNIITEEEARNWLEGYDY